MQVPPGFPCRGLVTRGGPKALRSVERLAGEPRDSLGAVADLVRRLVLQLQPELAPAAKTLAQRLSRLHVAGEGSICPQSDIIPQGGCL
eukprot:SAG11_NODE_8395_length_1021_cov_1.078091_1_plen_88_part_10